MMKRASTSHLLLLSAVSCYVSANMFAIFYVVTCNYHEYCLKTTKNSYDEGDVEELRDYPLSNTEIAERGVKRGIFAIGTSGVLLISPMKKLRE
jgi:hypothetical protein